MPLTCIQAVGFNGTKSDKLKIVVLLKVKILNVVIDLTFIVVPKLIKSCILGIDSLKNLNIVIDTNNDLVKFNNYDIKMN